MNIAEIKISMTGVEPKDVERYRKYFEKLTIDMITFERGFELRNGKIILNFNNDKKLMETEFQFKCRGLDNII